MLSKTKLKLVNFIIFLLILFMQILDNAERSGFSFITGLGTLKNGILLFACMFFLYQSFLKYKNNEGSIFNNELKNIILLAIIVGIISFYFILKQDQFSFQTIIGIIRILLPCVVAYSILNTLEFKEIYTCMVVYLIIGFGVYIFSIGLNNITFSNFMSISVVNSYSFFESHFFSVVAISSYLFFLYYRENRFYLLLSILFVFMTFKRPMILFVIISLILLPAINKKKEISKIWILGLKIGVVVSTLLYISILNGWLGDIIYDITGVTINGLTMGRAWFLEVLMNSNYQSYGLQSSVLHIGRNIEMDLVKIYMELSIVGLIAFVNYIVNLGKTMFYNYVMVVFVCVELLTSHFYDITYFWIILYITIGCVAYKKNDVQSGNRKIRFKF